MYLDSVQYDLVLTKKTTHKVQFAGLISLGALRSGQCFDTFLRMFVKPVVGAIAWNKRITQQDLKHDKLCTPSDEAFALLVLENNWERWVDIYQNNGYEIHMPKRMGASWKKAFYSNVKLRWTEGGHVYKEHLESEEVRKRRSKGWSTEGLHRFNKLYNRVIADRQSNPLALTEFIRLERGILHQRHCTSVTKKKRKVVVALADEFSDNENETDYAIKVNTDNTIGTTL